jgi:MinD-like ATPase involved in chromosome partitioning or flagellar assembly
MSINHGKPIVLDSPRHPVSQAIKRLALDCLADAPPLGREDGVEPPEAKRGGLLRRRSAR